jgi:hypothetical protein
MSNIFTGDWMMGPSRFCSEGICGIGQDLYYHFNTMSWSWQPSTYDDIIYIIDQLQGYKLLIEQYISNTKYGIVAGMVRSTEQCVAGYYSFVNNFRQVSSRGKEGLYSQHFAIRPSNQNFS